MMIRTAILGLLLTTGVLTATVQSAQADVLLGCRKVNFRAERDTIPVGGAAGRYGAIKLTVGQNPVEVFGLGVVYGNGNPDRLAVRSVIPAGGETRWIDLNGGLRFIRRIEIAYRSLPKFAGRATVCAYGR